MKIKMLYHKSGKILKFTLITSRLFYCYNVIIYPCCEVNIDYGASRIFSASGLFAQIILADFFI